MTILVCGGAGYIGAHTCVALDQAGYRDLLLLDNFSNSRPAVLDQLPLLMTQAPRFVYGDVRDAALLRRIFAKTDITAVIHFAGLKAVGESVERPLHYYSNNLSGLVVLLQAMQDAGCRQLVFSSSATVYGQPQVIPIPETHPRMHSNPYGHTKLVCEDVLHAVRHAQPEWRIGILRYFNPAGAHPSGLIGEDPLGTPSNLFPYVAQVAVGRMPYVRVFGGDYPTRDGTGVRDYLHVVDLANAHVAAVRRLMTHTGSFTVNLGTGRGYTVLEVIRAFSEATRIQIPYRIEPRRPGDVAECYADPGAAFSLLGWRATHGLDAMCADVWRWQRQHPNGLDDGAAVVPRIATTPPTPAQVDSPVYAPTSHGGSQESTPVLFP